MHRALAIVLASLAFALAGCPPPTTPPKKQPECSATKKCSGGLVCDNGVCSPCKRDNQCANDEICHPIQRRCVLKPCYGRECKVHDDCPLGEYCVQGLCLQPNVTTADGCQVISCEDGSACNEGQRCNPTTLVCEEDLGCQADSDCGPDQKCNVAIGECQAACTEATAASICGVKKVCFDGRCVDCTKNSDCGGGLLCNTDTNVCQSQSSCLSNRDCEPPLVCNHVTSECTVDPGPCLSAEDCGPTETCELATGKCVPAQCQADRFEPDDSLEAAKPLPSGLTPNLTLCQGDADWFKVALGNGDKLSIIVDADPLLSFEVAILNGAGDLVADGDLAASATVSVPGDYYVRLTSQDPYVAYGLRSTVSRGVPCDADPYEPNEDFQHAAPLPEGDTFGLTICPNDQDFFAVAANGGDEVEVDLTSSPTDGLLDLTILDSTGTHVLAKSASTDEVQVAKATVLSGSRVYVNVAGDDSTVQNSYDLHVAVKTP